MERLWVSPAAPGMGGGLRGIHSLHINPLQRMNETVPPAPRTRPTLLTVLCVLSFIGGGWAIISGIMTVLNPMGDVEKVQAQFEQAMEGMDELGSDNPMAGLMEGAMEAALKAAENAVPMSIANMVLAAIGLLGVWMMWNLRKTGFYLYTLASILALGVPFYFLGGGLLAMMSVGVGGFISLVFIILYGINLKHMS